jgi:hypothetical protein
MKLFHIAAATLAALTGLQAAPAVAQSFTYRVEAHSDTRIDMDICNPVVDIAVAGDGDTDLDFVVTNARGDILHSDYDLTDITYFTIFRQASSGCEDYALDVSNLGNVWNQFTVAMTNRPTDSAPVASGDSFNRNVSLVNSTKETIFYIYWSNIASSIWGIDQLGSSTLAAGQSWEVTINDGSGACRFNIKAVTASGREIFRNDVNVCEVYTIDLN